MLLNAKYPDDTSSNTEQISRKDQTGAGFLARDYNLLFPFPGDGEGRGTGSDMPVSAGEATDDTSSAEPARQITLWWGWIRNGIRKRIIKPKKKSLPFQILKENRL